MNWRDIRKELPANNQNCLVKMKHGYISGTWDDDDKIFNTYMFRDISFSGDMWVPIEELGD